LTTNSLVSKKEDEFTKTYNGKLGIYPEMSTTGVVIPRLLQIMKN